MKRTCVRVVKLEGRRDLVFRWIDPQTGKQRQQTAGTNNRRQANREAGRLLKEIVDGQLSGSPRMLWDEFRKRFEAERQPMVAERTQRAYRSSFNSYERVMRPHLLAEVSSQEISVFQARLVGKELSSATVGTYLRHLKAALRWAAEMGFLKEAPRIKMPKTRPNPMKGRPISDAEFKAMLKAVPDVVGKKRAPSWRHFLKGVWWSGLRAGEALNLYWDRFDRIRVDLNGRWPLLHIPAGADKSQQARIHPIAPEFASLLQETPAKERTGPVFSPAGYRGARPRSDWVSKTVSQIGKSAGVLVSEEKFASLHDFRRSFGVRWADRLPPARLKELMRHSSIITTQKYYLGQDAERTAEMAWAAFERAETTCLGVQNGVQDEKTSAPSRART